ncbi:hypothetical protein J6590_038825 [Homalodisca vitripennis]|nr:hypothetical protein J6590_038825 [Homalodisca vitripennis]
MIPMFMMWMPLVTKWILTSWRSSEVGDGGGMPFWREIRSFLMNIEKETPEGKEPKTHPLTRGKPDVMEMTQLSSCIEVIQVMIFQVWSSVGDTVLDERVKLWTRRDSRIRANICHS